MPYFADWCSQRPCPLFYLRADYDGYEVRTYKPATYAFTTVSTEFGYDKAVEEGVERMREYWAGDNDRKEVLENTGTTTIIAPVMTEENQVLPDTVEIAWYISCQSQKDPPVPNNSLITLSKVPEQSFAVKNFGGFATRDSILATLEPFYSQLFDDASLELVKAGHVGVAVFSPSTQHLNRYNELMVPVLVDAEDE